MKMSVIRLQETIKQFLSDEEIDKIGLQHIEKSEVLPLNFATLDLIDKGLLEELKAIVTVEKDIIYFGKSLREIKCVFREENEFRQHQVFVKYKAPKKLVITAVTLPYTPQQDMEFKTIKEIFSVYKNYISKLSGYFYELEKIDQLCTVMEPHKPSFKENYRRVLIDDRTWLHIEVTPEGLATNIHLVGHSEKWYDKLQSGLLSWDHDKDIVDNIMTMFDITEFPVASHKLSQNCNTRTEQHTDEVVTCGICLCDELPDIVGLPQPLCQNPNCGVYFHRDCLYQWLVACSGNRPPAFGVATGACPTCLQPITCSENDT